jgi:hypothetical protein
VSQTVVDRSRHIHVHSWDGKDRLVVSLDLLRAAFRENELLREYCDSPEKNRLEPAFINTYVLEALIAVINQAHRSPECRNIRLNPSRADQVQVLVGEGGERWKIVTLVEAVRLLFRDAAGRMGQLALAPEAVLGLTPVEQTASLLMSQAYQCRPERYEREGKSRLAAHLAALTAERELSPFSPAARDPATATVGPPGETQHLPIGPNAGELVRTAGVLPISAPADQTSGGPTDRAIAAASGRRPLGSSVGPTLSGTAPPLQADLSLRTTLGETLALPRSALPRRTSPPPFSPTAAVALLRQHPPQLDAEDRATPDALRKLEEISGQEANRIVNHLWDAKEEGMLTQVELVWAAALTRLCDGVD